MTDVGVKVPSLLCAVIESVVESLVAIEIRVKISLLMNEISLFLVVLKTFFQSVLFYSNS